MKKIIFPLILLIMVSFVFADYINLGNTEDEPLGWTFDCSSEFTSYPVCAYQYHASTGWAMHTYDYRTLAGQSYLPPFTAWKTIYNSIKECDIKEQKILGIWTYNKWSEISGVFEYHIGDFVPYDNSLSSCGGKDFMISKNMLYGYDGASCVNPSDYYRMTPVGSCSPSKSVIPFYIESCYFKCDRDSENVDAYFDTGCIEELVQLQNGKLKSGLSGRNCYDYSTRWTCDYSGYPNASMITMEFGCTLAMRRDYTFPRSFSDSTFLGSRSLEYIGYENLTQGSPYLNLKNYEAEVFGSQVFPRYVSGVTGKQEYYFPIEQVKTNDFYYYDLMVIADDSTNTTYIIPIENDTQPADGNGTGTGSGDGGSSGGKGKGGTGTGTDSSQVIKIVAVNQQVADAKDRIDFINIYLGVADAVFSIVLILFYMFELAVIIFVFFKWIPSSIYSVYDILKKLVGGKRQ